MFSDQSLSTLPTLLRLLLTQVLLMPSLTALRSLTPQLRRLPHGHSHALPSILMSSPRLSLTLVPLASLSSASRSQS
jgi:hypothetical protein